MFIRKMKKEIMFGYTEVSGANIFLMHLFNKIGSVFSLSLPLPFHFRIHLFSIFFKKSSPQITFVLMLDVLSQIRCKYLANIH